MTFRLVTLMSVVLLLSLASLGLLMGHYQDQVMEEVARTASAVGQATLRTLEVRASVAGEEGEMLVWEHAAPFEVEVDRRMVESEVHRAVVAHTGEPGKIPSIEQIEELLRSAAESGWVVDRRKLAERSRERDAATGAAKASIAKRLRIPHGPLESHSSRFFIKVEDVRAVSDPAQGLVLKIPKFTAASEEAESDLPNEFRHEIASGDAAGDVHYTHHEEIRLPIPVEDYKDLFASMRGRSLFLFLGVFLVGTVLSTGLATRFTRPIRRLDAGIRRLAEGDLDVEVRVQGENEIGRLSRAFNEMAGKLRANRERAREMVRRERLSALGGLAAGIAHDVRNPLHSIGLTLQHLTETARPESDERRAEFDRSLEIIRGEIRRLDQLVGNFLSFANGERSERVPIDLAELLGEIARLVQKEAERRGVELALDVDESMPPVPADGEALRSSILNLVLNSFEAMPDGGRLAITLRSEAGEALIEVADTGTGIPEEDQGRVFDFAYTTRENGSGLGLAMVHHCVVEEHGGRVSLESRVGEGTRVRLALPARRGAES